MLCCWPGHGLKVHQAAALSLSGRGTRTCSQRLGKAVRCDFSLGHTLCNPAYALGSFPRLFSGKQLQVHTLDLRRSSRAHPAPPALPRSHTGEDHSRAGYLFQSYPACRQLSQSQGEQGCSPPVQPGRYQRMTHQDSRCKGVDSQTIHLFSVNFLFTINESLQPTFSSSKWHSSLTLPWTYQIRIRP